MASITSPIVVGITSVLTEIAALVVGFGIMSNQQAGLAVALGTGIVVLAATIYASAHAHSTALVKAAQIRARASSPPAAPK